MYIRNSAVRLQPIHVQRLHTISRQWIANRELCEYASGSYSREYSFSVSFAPQLRTSFNPPLQQIGRHLHADSELAIDYRVSDRGHIGVSCVFLVRSKGTEG